VTDLAAVANERDVIAREADRAIAEIRRAWSRAEINRRLRRIRLATEVNRVEAVPKMRRYSRIRIHG
jgi:hypothetical protein